MAIQNRRGAYEDFDPDKLLPGEWATVLEGDPNAEDGKSTYLSYGNGDVKRMATYEDMDNNIKQSVTTIADNAANQAVAGAEGRIDNAINLANTATNNTNQIAITVENKLDAGEFIGPVGPQGIPGVSPEITAEDLPGGGHRVIITDATGIESFDVLNGVTVDEELSITSINPVQNKVTTNALNGKQNNLGFTPLQQGGGSGQLTNKIYIGWSGSKLKAQVDNVDQGNIAFEGWAKGQLNSKSNTDHTHSRLYNNIAPGQSVGLFKSGDNYWFYPDDTSIRTYLGGPSHLFRTAYLEVAPVVSSDMRLKTNYDINMDKYIAMLDLIEPTSYERIDESGKRHVGYLAQKVLKAMYDVGLAKEDFSGVQVDMQADGNVYTYSLAYEEFIPVLHAKIKQIETENTGLKAQVDLLEERLVTLEVMAKKG